MPTNDTVRQLMPPFVAVDDDHLTEDEKRERGNLLAHVLNIKRNRLTGRFTTKWGSKNSLGLYETIRNLIQEGK